MNAPFRTWYAVLDAARVGAWLLYHAPLDVRPTRVQVLRVYLNGSLLLRPATYPNADDFTADAGHLDRFVVEAP